MLIASQVRVGGFCRKAEQVDKALQALKFLACHFLIFVFPLCFQLLFGSCHGIRDISRSTHHG